MNTVTLRSGLLVASLALTALASAAHASGTHGGTHGHGGSAAVGEPGKPEEATRTIAVTMHDNYYEPEMIQVKAGETVRLVIKNEGQLVHEFNIGTPEMHAAHQGEMQMMVQHGALMPDRLDHERMKMDMGGGHTMEHDDPNSALLEPGKSAEIVWHFTEAGELEFACNVPGHYAAGMVGKIRTN